MKHPLPSRILELILLYVGTPLALLHLPTLAYSLWGINLRFWVIPSIISIALIVLLTQAAHGNVHKHDLLRVRVPLKLWCRMLLRFALLASILTLWLALKDPSRLLSFPLETPRFWALVMVCYPLFSVIPQAILYRWFFELRFAPIAPPKISLLIGATLFSFAHILFRNPYALAFTFVGGLCFLQSYRRTHSLLFSSVEHALFGNFLFTIGWGSYFFEGTQRLVQSTLSTL